MTGCATVLRRDGASVIDPPCLCLKMDRLVAEFGSMMCGTAKIFDHFPLPSALLDHQPPQRWSNFLSKTAAHVRVGCLGGQRGQIGDRSDGGLFGSPIHLCPVHPG